MYVPHYHYQSGTWSELRIFPFIAIHLEIFSLMEYDIANINGFNQRNGRHRSNYIMCELSFHIISDSTFLTDDLPMNVSNHSKNFISSQSTLTILSYMTLHV
jgi:hypothetical protein